MIEQLLDEATLHEWVVGQRWFASKSRAVAQLNVLDAVTLRDSDPELHLVLLEARFPTGTHDVYQLPVGIRPAHGEGVIARAGGRTAYDAVVDPELSAELVRLMAAGESRGDVRFVSAEGGPEIGAPSSSRPMGVEQSNTSLVFDDRLVLKVFRRLEPGTNPELEMLRFLTARGFAHIAALAGWYEYEGRLVDATLGVLQTFLAGGRDGWELTLDEMGSGEGQWDRLRDLGRVTGEMHTALASDPSDPHFAAEEPSEEYLSLLHADVDEQIERLWRDLPEDDERLEGIRGRGEDVRELLHSLSHVSGGKVIRTHGDYHLGQTMLTDRGWVILDFEGEPARSLRERRRKRSPLRDVAGMLRSFAYAQSALELLRGERAPEDWEARARTAFLEGYAGAADPGLLPAGSSAMEQLLAVFELEKAVYELRYEMNNRPDWVAIPAAAIRRLLEAA